MFHDYAHLGRVNQYYQEQEEIAFNELYKLLIKNNIHLKDSNIQLIKEIILGTEEKTNSKNVVEKYKLEKDKNSEIDNELKLKTLMVEADRLSSTLINCGLENGLLLSEEFKNEKINTMGGRLHYLEGMSFVSNASNVLEIEKNRIEQIEELKK